MPQALTQNFSVMLETLRAELAAVENQIAAVRELSNKRVQLLSAIASIEALLDPSSEQHKRTSMKGKRLVAGENTTAVVRRILRKHGPLKLERLVDLMIQEGWLSTGDYERDLKRAYHAMYNDKKSFKVKRPENTWELIRNKS